MGSYHQVLLARKSEALHEMSAEQGFDSLAVGGRLETDEFLLVCLHMAKVLDVPRRS